MSMNGSIHREDRRGRPTRYRVRWRDRPGANPRSKSFPRLAEARQYLAALQSEQAARARAEGAGYDYLPQKSLNLDEGIDAYYRSCEPGLRASTLEKHQTMAKLLRRDPVLCGKLLRQVTPGDVLELLTSTLASGYASSTVQTFRGYLSGLFTWAVTAGYADRNPVREVRTPKRASDPDTHLRTLDESEVMTPAQVRVLCESLPDWASLIAEVLAFTAMRQGEAAALTVGDWDSELRTLYINKTWSEKSGIGPPKTKAALRKIEVGTRVGRLLDDAAEGQDPTAPLLRAARRFQHFHPPSFRRAFDRTLIRAGLPTHYTPHSLRHSGISWWLAEGVPLEDVKRAAGHSSTIITQATYAHWVPDRTPELGPAMDRLSETLAPTLDGDR